MQEEKRKLVYSLYLNGDLLRDITKTIGVSRHTISNWVKSGISEGKISKRKRKTSGIVISQNWLEKRKEFYLLGLNSSPTVEDGVCIGLYWGEGYKAEPFWIFSNSERETVALMIKWAIRAGQPKDAFRARINAYTTDSISDEEIISYWVQSGVLKENIKVYRYPSRAVSSNHNKLPYGTCKLVSIKNGAFLFEYFAGQRHKIISTSEERK